MAQALPTRKAAPGFTLFKWILLGPLFGLLLFILPAFLLQLYFSFHSWTVYLGSWWEAEFVGLGMFIEVLMDSRFWWAVLRSLTFASLSTLGSFAAGFGLALLMHRPFRGHGLLYAVFILPMLTVPVVIAYTFEMLLFQRGPINGILSVLLQTDVRVTWLAHPAIAVFTVIMLEIWNWTPFVFIIMLAGLASLPPELDEAARILGASRWRIFREVQLPLLRPVIMLALILRFLEAMGEFPKTWGLLQGGPGSASETLPVYLFLTTWQYFHISKGAAMSYLVLIFTIVIVLAGIRLLRKEKQTIDVIYRKPGEEA